MILHGNDDAHNDDSGGVSSTVGNMTLFSLRHLLSLTAHEPWFEHWLAGVNRSKAFVPSMIISRPLQNDDKASLRFFYLFLWNKNESDPCIKLSSEVGKHCLSIQDLFTHGTSSQTFPVDCSLDGATDAVASTLAVGAKKLSHPRGGKCSQSFLYFAIELRSHL